MTVTVMKTKAELALAERHAHVVDQLPGGEAVLAARKDAIKAFEAAGLPHRRIEEWKYTDLRSALREVGAPAVAGSKSVTPADVDAALGALGKIDATRIVFIDGGYAADLSAVGDVAGLSIGSLAAILHDSTADVPLLRSHDVDDAVVALNTAFVTDGAIVTIEDGAEIDAPIVVAFVRSGDESRLATTRNVISIGTAAKVTLIEAHVALVGSTGGQTNTLTEIRVGDEADVSHIKCACEGGQIVHLANWMAELGRDVTYRGFLFTADVGLARNEVRMAFRGEGTRMDLSGAFLGRGDSHIDNTLVIDHAVPGCESRELFKGVLDGRARGIFQGKVIVRQNAQQTDGKQMAQALMLSEDAEFDSKPELEIYADDVACGHGSTCAELDRDLLFYCRARGIPEAEARALLIESFVGEAMEKVENDAVREALMDMARDWLRRG